MEGRLAGGCAGALAELPLRAGDVSPVVGRAAGDLADQVLTHDAPRLQSSTLMIPEISTEREQARLVLPFGWRHIK